MNINQTPKIGVSFSGEVKGKNGYTTKTSQFADQYAYANVCYMIREDAQKDTIEIKEKDGTTTIKGKMNPDKINLLAKTWEKMSNFFDKDKSTAGRNFEAQVTPDSMIFQYTYPDGEKFEWSQTKAEKKGVTGWDTIAEHLKDVFKEVMAPPVVYPPRADDNSLAIAMLDGIIEAERESCTSNNNAKLSKSFDAKTELKMIADTLSAGDLETRVLNQKNHELFHLRINKMLWDKSKTGTGTVITYDCAKTPASDLQITFSFKQLPEGKTVEDIKQPILALDYFEKGNMAKIENWLKQTL